MLDFRKNHLKKKEKGGNKMEDKEIELALEIVNRQAVKDTKAGKSIEKLKERINEKNEIYKGNKEVIKKVIEEYKKEGEV